MCMQGCHISVSGQSLYLTGCLYLIGTIPSPLSIECDKTVTPFQSTHWLSSNDIVCWKSSLRSTRTLWSLPVGLKWSPAFPVVVDFIILSEITLMSVASAWYWVYTLYQVFVIAHDKFTPSTSFMVLSHPTTATLGLVNKFPPVSVADYHSDEELGRNLGNLTDDLCCQVQCISIVIARWGVASRQSWQRNRFYHVLRRS